MKIIAIGDLHLGFQFGTERGEDTLLNAKNAFEKALSLNPDIFLILGDIFHEKVPKPEVLSQGIELFQWVKSQLKQKVLVVESVKNKKKTNINQEIFPIISIFGTHEMRHKDSINPVQLLEKVGLLGNLHKESILIEKEGTRIGIHGLSGVPDQYASKELKEWSPKPFLGVPNFLLVHQTFREMIPIREDTPSYSDLPDSFSAILAGHIHWQQEDKHPINNSPILYAGSTILTQLKQIESVRKKGFYLLETEGPQFKSYNFIEIDTRRPFHYIDLDITGKNPSDIIQEVENAVNSKSLENKPLIRVRLKGKLAKGFLPTDLQLSKIIKQYSDKAFLSVDKSKVVSEEVSERASLLANLKAKQASVEEIGIELLSKQLEGVEKEKVKELFRKLASGDLEGVEI